ncbi:membrane protein insertion efficiency factor YidD [Rhizobium sp. CB3090]|uniref:membrane protein insertion efficiency factor YidD n=1 Tax=Rhizobium sp. CB3090 TaxID=3039156 RepID=UPI0024B07D58|nr:membrane protein insertion efficiency factor YidD [Rhizobium sp. CB3090]WFU10618.1 membrane protein insertion efficiency factor YidD [Rhizobium sp. CB3090]
MCHLCSMQDDEVEGGAAAGSKRIRRDEISPHGNSKPRHSRNYSGPFRKTPDRLLGMALIRFYQLTLSGFIGNSCRHIPTCSEYGYESIARHGLWAGGWMTLFRVARCGPGGTSGLDPVPETLENRYHWWTPWRYFRLGQKVA